MKSRKTPGAVVIILILSALVLFFVNPWRSIQKDDRRILLKDPAKVDQILVSGPMGRVELIRSGEDWLLPDGEKASQVQVENLLFAAGRLQVNAVFTDLSEWESDTAKQFSFLSSGKLVLQYEALGTNGGLLLVPSGSEKVYAASLPGYPDLNLAQVFSESAYHYRDHLLINLLPRDIRQIEVEKKGSPPFRFTRDEADEISCKFPQADSLVPMEFLDEEAVRMLFTYFTSIAYEERAVGPADLPTGGERDERWLANIAVESVGGQKHKLQVYSLPGDEGESAHMFKALVFHNNSPEPLVVKYIYLDVLMRGLPAYFGDNSLRH